MIDVDLPGGGLIRLSRCKLAMLSALRTMVPLGEDAMHRNLESKKLYPGDFSTFQVHLSERGALQMLPLETCESGLALSCRYRTVLYSIIR